MRKCGLILLLTVVAVVKLFPQSGTIDISGYRKPDSVASIYAGASLYDLKALAEKLTGNFTKEEDKFRALYYWVCTNIEGDYPFYKLNKQNRYRFRNRPLQLMQWNAKFSRQVFDKLLKERKTICTGYAYLIRELSYWAGLNCIIVDGYGRSASSNVGGNGTPNHTWNAIQLNGVWYLCDATWSSGTIDPVNGKFTKKFDESYYLPDPGIFIYNHFPLDSSLILIEDKPKLVDFLNRPFLYRSAYRYEIKPLNPLAMNIDINPGETVLFQFEKGGGEEMDTAVLQINGRKYPKEIKNDRALYSLAHRFTKKGKQMVHILIDNQYVLTYVVTVR